MSFSYYETKIKKWLNTKEWALKKESIKCVKVENNYMPTEKKKAFLTFYTVDGNCKKLLRNPKEVKDKLIESGII